MTCFFQLKASDEKNNCLRRLSASPNINPKEKKGKKRKRFSSWNEAKKQGRNVVELCTILAFLSSWNVPLLFFFFVFFAYLPEASHCLTRGRWHLGLASAAWQMKGGFLSVGFAGLLLLPLWMARRTARCKASVFERRIVRLCIVPPCVRWSAWAVGLFCIILVIVTANQVGFFCGSAGCSYNSYYVT